jgi:hypothetical protein
MAKRRCSLPSDRNRRSQASTPTTARSMSSIKRDVKKKTPPRPEAEKILVSRPSPLL